MVHDNDPIGLYIEQILRTVIGIEWGWVADRREGVVEAVIKISN